MKDLTISSGFYEVRNDTENGTPVALFHETCTEYIQEDVEGITINALREALKDFNLGFVRNINFRQTPDGKIKAILAIGLEFDLKFVTPPEPFPGAAKSLGLE